MSVARIRRRRCLAFTDRHWNGTGVSIIGLLPRTYLLQSRLGLSISLADVSLQKPCHGPHNLSHGVLIIHAGDHHLGFVKTRIMPSLESSDLWSVRRSSVNGPSEQDAETHRLVNV